MEANNKAGAITITLPPGTYSLSIVGTEEDQGATGDLDITDDVTITGAGEDTTIIDGGGIDRVFHVLKGSTVEITGMMIENGNAVGGGGIHNRGGGIHNSGSLTLIDSTIAGKVLGWLRQYRRVG